MPNWCLNRLTVEHEDGSKVDEFLEAYRKSTTCEHYLPTPRDADGEFVDGGNQDEEGNFKMPDWYTWRLNNWGTKWDIGCLNEDGGSEPTRVGNELSMRFESAWSPPLGLYERLVALGFDVKASYFEPGMQFAGTWINNEDNFYEGEQQSDFPADLVEAYDIGAWN